MGRAFYYLTQVATLKLKYAGKPLFAANCTDFREFQKNPCKLAKLAARILRFFAWWQLGLFM
jgi:YHS domain-containing protein